jgi:hypothetical protein
LSSLNAAAGDLSNLARRRLNLRWSEAAEAALRWMCGVAMVVAMAGLARAQAPEPIGIDEAGLRGVARYGAIATLAPLCALRDQDWGEDLRQAMVQEATGADVHDADDLRQAPGQQLAVAALGYADTEALEDFAEDTPGRTCDTLRANPDLRRADDHVRAWRQRIGRPVG